MVESAVLAGILNGNQFTDGLDNADERMVAAFIGTDVAKSFRLCNIVKNRYSIVNPFLLKMKKQQNVPRK